MKLHFQTEDDNKLNSGSIESNLPNSHFLITDAKNRLAAAKADLHANVSPSPTHKRN